MLTVEAPVQGELGKVYSTSPEIAFGADGLTYYIKGRNSPTAFSEVAGCRLAALAGIRAPKASVGEFNGDLYAAVEEVPKPERNMRHWLRSLDRIKNQSQLFEIIAVDTWLVNDDRNMGNIVGSAIGDGCLEITMIDFEKSRTLGVNPFTTAATVDPKRLWPTAELGEILKKIRPKRCPASVIERILSISVDEIRGVIVPIAAELPLIQWYESSIELLERRAKIIDTLVDEVWKTN